MNLLIIPSWYPSSGSPLNGIFFKEQAISLSKRGHNVTVIDVTFHGRQDIFNSKNFRLTYEKSDNIHVYALKIPSFYFLSRARFLHIMIYRFLLFLVYKKIMSKGLRYDVIHAHSFYPAGYCACKLSEKYRIPLVVTEHSSNVLKAILKKSERKLLEYTINYCIQFICVSEALKQSIHAQIRTNKELIVISNLCSSVFSYSEVRRKNGDFIFLSVGNLVDGKRHAFTISCFNEAFKDNSNVKLRIAGNGELYELLKDQIYNDNLVEKVKLLGLLSREQIKMELADCNAFVLASAYETFGIVYIEAMACGRPVIAVRNGGANDIINETNGILIDVDNEEQLIQAFQYMYQNADKFDNEQIAADCEVKYSEEAIIKQLSSIYENLVN